MTETARARVLLVQTACGLGPALATTCKRRGVPLVIADADELNLSDRDGVCRLLSRLQPTLVINAAGVFDEEAAEEEFQAALHDNGLAAANLAIACRESRALLVTYSSSHVFAGNAEVSYGCCHERDPATSLGLSQLAGEQALAASGCEYLLIRTGRLFSAESCTSLHRLLTAARQVNTINVPDDEVVQYTSCADLAEMTLKLIASAARQAGGEPLVSTIHAANTGAATAYEFADAAIALAGIDCHVRPMAKSASRINRVLDLHSMQSMIERPRHWRKALSECISAMRRELVACSYTLC